MARLTKRKTASYVELHNRAVERFRKSSRILIWAGIFNVLGLAVGIVQIFSSPETEHTLPLYFCFGLFDIFFNLIIKEIIDWSNAYVGFGLAIFVAMIMSIGAILLSVFASQGRKRPLIIATGLYFIDWVLVLIAYFLSLESWQNLIMSCGFHLIISACLAYAIYQYFNVINIEKRFVNKSELAEETKGE